MYWTAIAQVSGSDATTTSTGATNVTGLTFAAAANKTYEIEAYLIATDSNTNGCLYTTAFSAAGAVGASTARTHAVAKNSPANNFTDLGALGTNTLHQIAATKIGVTIVAFVAVGATPGNITIQHAVVTSGTSTISIGSIMKVKLLA